LSIAAWSKPERVPAWSVYARRKRLSAPAPAKLISPPLAGTAPCPMLEMQTPTGCALRLSSVQQHSWLSAIGGALRSAAVQLPASGRGTD
jgi:hypothetical protein